MTTKTPQQASAVEAKCQKCGSQAKSIEYDIIGMVITCTICGKCVYMDRNNQPIEEQQQQPKIEKDNNRIPPIRQVSRNNPHHIGRRKIRPPTGPSSLIREQAPFLF